MKHTGIAVIEGKWWRKHNTSMRGLLDLVADIACGNPHAYHYEMANSEAALKEAILRIASYRECKYLCLSMHGDFDGLHTISEERLSRAELRNLLCKIVDTKGSKFTGLHIGSCLFSTQNLADFLFERRIKVDWIAGYSTEVDWIHSSALDLLFLNELMVTDGITEAKRIQKTAESILKLAPDLANCLGFGIYVRKKGGGIKNLLNFSQDGTIE